MKQINASREKRGDSPLSISPIGALKELSSSFLHKMSRIKSASRNVKGNGTHGCQEHR